MTNYEILQAIKDHQILRTLADNGSDATIADAIRSFQPPVHDGRRTREADLLRILGPEAGNAAIVSLAATYPALERVLRSDGLDLSSASTPAFFQNLVSAGVVTADQAAAIMADHMRLVRISAEQVSDTLLPYRPEGRVGPIAWGSI